MDLGGKEERGLILSPWEISAVPKMVSNCHLPFASHNASLIFLDQTFHVQQNLKISPIVGLDLALKLFLLAEGLQKIF